MGVKNVVGVEQGTTETFIEKAKKIHGDKYDYSNVNYINNKTKVSIICHEKNVLGEEHGIFHQRPNDHLSGYGCSKCGKNYVPSTEEWVAKAKNIYGDKYDYSKVNYINTKHKICITCPIHGDFLQSPNNHLNGCECPHCNSDNKSKMEEEVDLILNENNIKHERQKTFEWLKHKRNLFLDFFISSLNIGIEVQGEQHYRPVKRFGGEKFFKLQNERDKIKKELCEKHNIKLFYVNRKENNIYKIIEYIRNDKNDKRRN